MFYVSFMFLIDADVCFLYLYHVLVVILAYTTLFCCWSMCLYCYLVWSHFIHMYMIC